MLKKLVIEAVIALTAQGWPADRIAVVLGVSRPSVIRYRKVDKERINGELPAEPERPRRTKPLPTCPDCRMPIEDGGCGCLPVDGEAPGGLARGR